MTGSLRLSILFLITLWVGFSLEQHSPYSLQTAVDALHRREAQLALKDSDFNPSRRYYQDERYWGDEESEIPSNRINRLKLNRLLARYLAREDENEKVAGYGFNGQYDNNEFEEDENYLPEEKKRSFFREREEEYEPPYQTLFRERELGAYQPDLTEEFLREIEEKKELEEEEKYKEQLRRLWEKYQQEENEIEEELFDEQQKRRHPMANNIGLYYAGPPMERKRQYPVLPWLPYSKKKRFPVAKRSPKPLAEDTSTSGTDETVAKDLQAIFGNTNSAKAAIDSKKKRSTSNEETPKDDKSTSAPTPESKKANSPENHITGNAASSHKHDEHQHEHHHQHQSHDHHHHHQGHDIDSGEHASDEDESSEEHDHEHEHDADEDEDDHDFDDEDDDDRKKKRDVSSAVPPSSKSTNLEVIREDQIIPGDLTDFRRKKAIQWSKYFGIDRRKKSAPWYMGNGNSRSEELIKDSDNEGKHQKHEINPEKLENMDKKLKTIEDLIIDETIKYTGAHEGISDPEEIQQLKDHVVSRLATAYSLEKMRIALEKLRESIDNENHIQRNQIEYEANSNNSNNNSANKDTAKEKEKRVAVKKEKAELNGNQHPTESSSSRTDNLANNLEDSLLSSSILPPLDEKKRKRKRTGIPRYLSNMPNDISDFEEELGAGHFEPLNENLGVTRTLNMASGDQMQCPILDSMADRCRGVDILSGDIHQELLSVCGIHQLCYLCGTSQIACDFQYLSEADSVCGRNNACQSAARSALMILRGSPGPQFGPKECLKNPCLYRAMREIGL